MNTNAWALSMLLILSGCTSMAPVPGPGSVEQQITAGRILRILDADGLLRRALGNLPD